MAHTLEEKQAIVTAICEKVARGELVTTACKEKGITRTTLHRWTESDDAFRDAYARARIDQAHAIAEDAILIADGEDAAAKARIEAMVAAIQDADDDDKDRILSSLQSAAVQRDRIRVDTRKWMASKIAPRLYGDKLELTGDPDRPVQVQVWQFGERQVAF